MLLRSEHIGAIPVAQKGAANGVASLDASGLVPSNQLPSYVDDVLEYASVSNFPVSGEIGKIYVATDTNKSYRWSGSSYIELSSYALATQAAAGLMSATDKTKLDGIVPSNLTLNSQLIGAHLLYDGEKYPVAYAPKGGGQYTYFVRNTATGAFYTVWYSESLQAFMLGLIISGAAPNVNEPIDIQYFI